MSEGKKIEVPETEIQTPQHTVGEDGIAVPVGVPINTEGDVPESSDFDYSTLSYQEIRKIARSKEQETGRSPVSWKQEDLVEYLNEPDPSEDPQVTAKPEGPEKNEALERIKQESYDNAGIEPPEEEKPKQQFDNRQQELLARIKEESESRVNIDKFLDGKDADLFTVPPEIIPDGFSVEWKNTHIMGQPVDHAYNLGLEQGGWRPAPAELFPGLVPAGYAGEYVERPGMILMIRPQHITDKVHAERVRRAREQMGDKMVEMGQTPHGQMDRVVKKLDSSYEPIVREGAGQSVPE